MPKKISCATQDYFEAACLYHYQIAVELIDGSKISGEAVTLKTISKIEYLAIRINETELLINLAEIKKLDVLTPNARFTQIKI